MEKETSKKYFYIITSIVSIVAFIGLAVCVKLHLNFINVIDSYEHHVLVRINNLSVPTINFLSNLGSPLVGILLITGIALFLCYQKNFLAGFLTETAMLLGNGIAELLKITIARERPPYQLYLDKSFSFPSGHVFDTTLLILVIITFILPQLKNETYQIICGVLLVIWNGFIIFSRIYLGMHYFTDVLGSVFLALAIWTFTLFVRQFYLERISK